MQNQPTPARGQQIDFVAPFTGKCGQALQFILLGSLVFNLLLVILGPLAEITSKAYYIIMMLLSSGLTIFGFFQLFSTTKSTCLKRTSILFILAEVLVLLGIITVDSGIGVLYNPSRLISNSVILSIGAILFIISPAVLIGDDRITTSNFAKSWPIWVGVFRVFVIGIFLFIILQMENAKLAAILIGLINFAITYFMWITILAPEQSVLNQKK